MSFTQSIYQTLVVGQLLGLMPITGVTAESINLKFKWKSFRFFHCVVVFIASFIFLVAISVKAVNQEKHSLETFVTISIYLSSSVSIVLFLKLAQKWPRVAFKWEEAERSLPASNSLKHQLNLRLWIVVASSIRKYFLRCYDQSLTA